MYVFIFAFSDGFLFLLILTTIGYFHLVTRLFHLENLLQCCWRSNLCASKLPAYNFYGQRMLTMENYKSIHNGHGHGVPWKQFHE